MRMGRKGVRFQEEGREWILSGLLYADDLFLYSESEEDLKVMVGRFVDVCRKRDLKVNAGKNKVMVLGGEEELEYEVHGDGIRLGLQVPIGPKLMLGISYLSMLESCMKHCL